MRLHFAHHGEAVCGAPYKDFASNTADVTCGNCKRCEPFRRAIRKPVDNPLPISTVNLTSAIKYRAGFSHRRSGR